MKTRVLIVEDDAPVRVALQQLLEDAAYEVAAAADARSAVREFALRPCQAVILDLNLPDQSGWVVLEAIREESPDVPILVITGLDQQFPACAAAGVTALLEKPLEAQALLHTLRDALARPPDRREPAPHPLAPRTRYHPSLAAAMRQRLQRQATTPLRLDWQRCRSRSFPVLPTKS